MAEPSAELPLVDLDGSSAESDLGRGLFETGFFLLRDHVVPRRLLDDVRSTTALEVELPVGKLRGEGATPAP